MIKLGFKLFGLFTVIFFLTGFAIYLAVDTVPPVYNVRDEVKQIVYPTARENLKTKFNALLEGVRNGDDVREFKISEIEANSYLYYMLCEKIAEFTTPFIENPYLFIDENRLRLRLDIPVESLIQIVNNKNLNIDENIKSLVEAKRTDFTIALTFIININWVNKTQRPFIYLERVYIGVMPVPISILFFDYQNQFNDYLWRSLENFFKHLPAYITKIELKNKEVVFTTEAAVTDRVASARKYKRFQDTNPELYTALQSKNCLYGCTAEEAAALEKFYSEMTGFGAADIEMSQILRAEIMLNKMEERRNEKIFKPMPGRESPYEPMDVIRQHNKQ